jgi:hypothetical protein
MRRGGRVLLIIRTVWRSTTKIRASLCLLSLPYLHANSTGTTGPARILRILPRLPPSQPTHHLSRAKCGGLFPHPLRSFLLLRIPPHLPDPRTTMRIERSSFLC